jgi:hypothetical protein
MKKGATEAAFGLIIIMILGIIYAIFSMNVLGKISKATDEIAKDALCAETLRLSAEKRLPVIEAFARKEDAEYQCPTKYITIYKDRVEKEYDDFTPEDKPIVQKFDEDCSKLKTSSQYKRCVLRNTNKFMAKEMVSCWNKFHQGTVPLFSQHTDDRQCLVCSVFYFDAQIQEELGGDYVGWQFDTDPELSLDAYMRQNFPLEGYADTKVAMNKDKVEKADERTGTTSYFVYTLDLIDKYVEAPYYDYDPQYDYTIVLTALNKKRAEALGDRIKNLLLGKDDPRGEFINTMSFIENEQVTTLCDTIV